VFPGYTALAVIGKGAASTIYKVRSKATGNIFALKQAKKEHDQDGKIFEQVLTEYKIGRQITHPNVRQVHELHRVRKGFRVVQLQLLLEYLEGQIAEQVQVKDLSSLCSIFTQVATGLLVIHEEGFVHADIKPNNIMLCPDNRVRIIDLGQSCPMATVKKRIQGTPDFIAPEQVLKMPLDARTDVYNLGATMYWFLTGRPYPTRLKSKRTGASFNLDTTQEVQTPQECSAMVPGILSNLVMDCCRNNPGSRPKDMNEVLNKLRNVSQVILRKEPQPDGPVKRPSDSNSD